MKKKLFIIIGAVVIVVAAVIVVLTLRSRGGEEPVEEGPTPIEAPVLYELETTSVIAFPVGDSIVVTEEKAEEDSGEEGEESEEPQESEETEGGREETGLVTYHYQGLAAPVERIAAYCDFLTAEDFGFVPVDESIMETELPDFTGEQAEIEEEAVPMAEGSVHLVRPIVDEAGESIGALFSLRLGWNQEECTVAVSQLSGGITPTPTKSNVPAMSITEAMDFFYNLHPAELGLAGDTMEGYGVFALDGAVMVNGEPCLRVNIYSKDPVVGTNVIEGQYLLSGDGRKLYLLDREGKAQEIFR